MRSTVVPLHESSRRTSMSNGSLVELFARRHRLCGGIHYDARNDAHIIMNFGSTTEIVRSFRTLIRIEGLLHSGR
jgi:hypothetical protein